MSIRQSKPVSGFRPKKSLGQNFLHSPHVIHKIISNAGFQESDLVLEIGPGKGALTKPLSRLVRKVIAVEKDTQLATVLEKDLFQEGIENIRIINQDILKWDFKELSRYPSARRMVVGNLPYNISTPFLDKLIDNRAGLSKAILMFQREIAQRITSNPGNKIYGAMSVLVQYHARAEPLVKVSRNAFFPRPKVDSMVLKLDFDQPHENRVKDEDVFKRVVRGAFSHRRKTLINSFRSVFPHLNRDGLAQDIQQCNIDPGIRAEMLTIDDFVCLADAMRLT